MRAVRVGSCFFLCLLIGVGCSSGESSGDSLFIERSGAKFQFGDLRAWWGCGDQVDTYEIQFWKEKASGSAILVDERRASGSECKGRDSSLLRDIDLDSSYLVKIRALRQSREGPWETIRVEAKDLQTSTKTTQFKSDPQPKSKSLSVEEEQAVRSARSYLDYSGFSKTGLISQLEYEGFPKSVASAAVNSLVVDWDQEAYESGKSYLDYSSFSKSGLIEQLKYEGFTSSQATQAANRLFG